MRAFGPYRTRRAAWTAAELMAVSVGTDPSGPQPGLVVSFAAVPVRDGRVKRGESHVAAWPTGAPTSGEPRSTVSRALAGRFVVSHAAWFDTLVLAPLLGDRGARLRRPVLDTMALGREVLRRRPGHGAAEPTLDELASALGVDRERPRGTLGDALMTARVFVALASELGAGSGPPVSYLQTIARRARPQPLLFATPGVSLLFADRPVPPPSPR